MYVCSRIREILAQAEPTIRSRGENNPTRRASDSRMRADERRNHRGSQGMLQYMRVAPVRVFPPPSSSLTPLGAPPSEFLLLLRFNEMLRPLARDYFPIAPINSPFDRSRRLSWRDSGTPFLSLTIPRATNSVGDTFVPD